MNRNKATPPPPTETETGASDDEPVLPTVPDVWWGSEEFDGAQVLGLKATVATFSKKGEHKLHANEDRYAAFTDLGAELAAKLNGSSYDGAPAGSTPPSHCFFGVYDGHGGSSAAQHLASRLHLLLAADPALWRESPRQAMINAFALAESELRQTYERDREDHSGSCACVGLLRGRRLTVAHTGDCRMVLLRGETCHEPVVQMTRDHRATEPSEQKRILRSGGKISDGRVWGALMPSRTLGDFPWKDKGPGLSAEPEICEYEITPDDKYLVLGSDGLFDVHTNKSIGKVVCKMTSSAQKVNNELQKELRKKPTGDDCTMIVVALQCV